jgi:1-acyl-sn-glycerol-3-phosphate acyltransferase
MKLPRLSDLKSLHLREEIARRLLTPEIDALIARTPKPVGSFGYDPWGYNENTVRLGLALCKLLYDRYFRVTASGLENIPKKGPVLIVGNHSGQLPMDGILVAVALMTNPHAPRAARAMVERFFPTVPYIGNLLMGLGAAIGDPHNCAKMLDGGEAIIVFPEGVRGSGKPFRQRYQLQRFGNGFMHLAMHHRTPIVPVGIVGCEETMPSLANIAPLAKLFGVPYVPLVPAPLPLPARVYLNFGAPMHFDGEADDEQEITERVEGVKDRIRALIDTGLQQRTRIF